MAQAKAPFNFGPFDDVRGVVRSLAVTQVGGLFLTLAGAFGSGQAPIYARLVYWVVLMGLGWLWGILVSRFFFRQSTWPGREVSG